MEKWATFIGMLVTGLGGLAALIAWLNHSFRNTLIVEYLDRRYARIEEVTDLRERMDFLETSLTAKIADLKHDIEDGNAEILEAILASRRGKNE